MTGSENRRHARARSSSRPPSSFCFSDEIHYQMLTRSVNIHTIGAQLCKPSAFSDADNRVSLPLSIFLFILLLRFEETDTSHGLSNNTSRTCVVYLCAIEIGHFCVQSNLYLYLWYVECYELSSSRPQHDAPEARAGNHTRFNLCMNLNDSYIHLFMYVASVLLHRTPFQSN